MPLSTKHKSSVLISGLVKCRKGYKITKLSKVHVEWGLSIKDAKSFSIEHDAATCECIHIRKTSSLSAPKVAPKKASTLDPTATIQLFNAEVDKKERVEYILIKINRSKYDDVLNGRFSLDPFVKSKCSKPKGKITLTVNLMRKYTKGV